MKNQAMNILAILDSAGRDFLVERTSSGWRVETEQTEGIEGYSCEGVTLADCLGQVTQVLACELGLDTESPFSWLHDGPEDVDFPAPFALEGPVEFCQPMAFDDPCLVEAFHDTDPKQHRQHREVV